MAKISLAQIDQTAEDRRQEVRLAIADKVIKAAKTNKVLRLEVAAVLAAVLSKSDLADALYEYPHLEPPKPEPPATGAAQKTPATPPQKTADQKTHTPAKNGKPAPGGGAAHQRPAARPPAESAPATKNVAPPKSVAPSTAAPAPRS